jgi:2,3-bisphosphoglycerate-independent phosphoglycerate mutase
MNKTHLLCILDGVGLNPRAEANAVAIAKKPNIDRLFKDYPHTTLQTHGERVGLPDGQMGNSEVGHLNIGAGRVVEQWLFRIGKFLREGQLGADSKFSSWLSGIEGAVHICGLCSDGGVHSHIDHIEPVVAAIRNKISAPIKLHLFTDGRDTAPKGGSGYVRQLEGALKKYGAAIATIGGRYFGMDRDNRWERVKKAYDAIILGRGGSFPNAEAGIADSYQRNVTDEFIEPFTVNFGGASAKDSFLFFNFREDRMREIAGAITGPSFKEFERPFVIDANRCISFTQYGKESKVPVLFEHTEIRNYLGEYLAAQGVNQLRVAETEKYPHVTYFLNGGNEVAVNGEERRLVPSPRDVATYDLKPEMSARGVTDAVIEGIRSQKFGLIVVNFANGDMVGHTGVLAAAVKAVETVDQCLGEILETLSEFGGRALILADHGNCEQMINYNDGTPHTSHTTYPVPLVLISDRASTIRAGGALCDVAPTMLDLMGLKVPEEMSGRSLLQVKSKPHD